VRAIARKVVQAGIYSSDYVNTFPTVTGDIIT